MYCGQYSQQPKTLIGQALDGSIIWDFYLRADSKVEAFDG